MQRTNGKLREGGSLFPIMKCAFIGRLELKEEFIYKAKESMREMMHDKATEGAHAQIVYA